MCAAAGQEHGRSSVACGRPLRPTAFTLVNGLYGKRQRHEGRPPREVSCSTGEGAWLPRSAAPLWIHAVGLRCRASGTRTSERDHVREQQPACPRRRQPAPVRAAAGSGRRRHSRAERGMGERPGNCAHPVLRLDRLQPGPEGLTHAPHKAVPRPQSSGPSHQGTGGQGHHDASGALAATGLAPQGIGLVRA
ncbi:hypothetical protein J7E95_29025 [Streptomyces sp. ISL-14]|nr:hypothetical protein [Streptomyces sp. ISL-14]